MLVEHQLQWVAISIENDKTIIKHQFDEDGNQTPFSYVKDLEKSNELQLFIVIPRNERLDNRTEKMLELPFISVDLKEGQMNINGTEFNFLPEDVDFPPYSFRVIYFHTIEREFNTTSLTEVKTPFIKQYKIGWQATVDGKNYQRILFYDTNTSVFSLKSKR